MSAKQEKIVQEIRRRIERFEKLCEPRYYTDNKTFEYWECPFCGKQGGEDETQEHICAGCEEDGISPRIEELESVLRLIQGDEETLGK